MIRQIWEYVIIIQPMVSLQGTVCCVAITGHQRVNTKSIYTKL